MNTLHMDYDERLAMKDAEIRSLQEELVRERNRSEAAIREADMVFEQLIKLSREASAMREQIASWTAEADKKAAFAQQIERQGYEL